MLEARAELLNQVRALFQARGSLEVDVPVIADAPASDPWIDSFRVSDPGDVSQGFLLSSPEPYLKRLLAANPRPIHSIGKAFRASESGRLHAREFTMVEWYRPSDAPFGDLVRDLQDVVISVTAHAPPEVVTYRQCFEAVFTVNPHQAERSHLVELAQPHVGRRAAQSLDDDSLLNLLFASHIEPELSGHIVIDFPAMQACLAETASVDGDQVAKRAELYLNGMELANGYAELTDAHEQSRRFDEDRVRRQQLGRPEVPRDQALLDALESGLLTSYGVALGFDRLLMVVTGAARLSDCLSFTEGV
jgi:lysyl-tRNA synthetase class 2